MAARLATALCLLVAGLGALGVVSPDALLAVARRFQSPSGLYAAAVLRIGLGAALLTAAPGSRAPRAVRVIGVIVLVAGLLTPALGVETLRRVLEAWTAHGPLFVRTWAALGMAFGGVTAYLLQPRSRPA